ncbi:MAG: YIEGIA family protein [Symbiobacteriia bacterium]
MNPDSAFDMTAFLVGLIAGVVARYLMLRIDYRQYPGYPHGYVMHLTHGFIAAGLGAIAWPALLSRELSAVTFLALAASQFRDTRRLEREALSELEQTEMVKRGLDYIEGIAKVFEARNYLVMFVALTASVVAQEERWPAGVIAAMLAYLMAARLSTGEQVGNLVRIHQAPVTFDGALLKVGNIGLMNVGAVIDQEAILKHGLGAILEPITPDARRTLSDAGQRQAILHDVATVVGPRMDVDTIAFTPLARRDLDTGAVGFFVMAEEPDFEVLTAVVRTVPVLETARSRAAHLITTVRHTRQRLGPKPGEQPTPPP